MIGLPYSRFAMLKNREEIKSIQILRAIAVLGVFYYHFANARERDGGVFPLFGSFGVDIFFIISGFIIGYMVSKTTEKFFIKRIIRILPLYIIVTSLVILSVLLFPQLVYATKIGFTEFIKSILFIPYKNEYRKTSL